MREQKSVVPCCQSTGGTFLSLRSRETCDARFFLQYDSGVGDESRLLIFATDENLDYLEKSSHWLGDGTFPNSVRKRAIQKKNALIRIRIMTPNAEIAANLTENIMEDSLIQ